MIRIGMQCAWDYSDALPCHMQGIRAYDWVLCHPCSLVCTHVNVSLPSTIELPLPLPLLQSALLSPSS